MLKRGALQKESVLRQTQKTHFSDVPKKYVETYSSSNAQHNTLRKAGKLI